MIKFIGIFNLVVTFILICWGALVTSFHAGMVVPDWPLSYGSVNPEGWWQSKPVLLEHGHRLIATMLSLGATFLLTLCWKKYLKFESNKSLQKWLQLWGIFLIMAGQLFCAIAAGKTESQWKFTTLLLIAIVLLTISLTWWLKGWRKKNWHVLIVLTFLSLQAVIFQAIMGGLRVTEISDSLATAHGIFAQLFFCLQVLILLKIPPPKTKEKISPSAFNLQKQFSYIFLVAIFIQLVLGAVMRHMNRVGLPNPLNGVKNDFPLYDGNFLPSEWHFDILVHFLHRNLAYFIFVILVIAFVLAMKKKQELSFFFKNTSLLLALVCGQVAIAAFIIFTRKHPHTTTLHLVVGLLIIALSFYNFIRCREIYRKT